MAQLKDLIVTGASRFLGNIYGNLKGNADTATKATQDSAGQQINTTYIKGLSVSGRTVTYTKGDGTPGTITTQDTTYSNATTSTAGLMSKDDKAKLDAITASADAVSFSRSLTSGTKVGTITINGTGTDLYAPTNTDTHYTTGLKVGASNTATANATASNGNVYLNVLDNTTVRDSHKIVGSGATTVTSDANGVITINSTNTTYSTATTSANGLMSSTDKSKLDGIATGATKTIVDTALSSTSTNPVQNKVVNTAISNLNTLVGTKSVATQISDYAAPKSHTHNYAGSSSAGGSATSANKLATARTIALAGDVTGSTSFDGSGNVSITTTVADNSHYHSIDTISKGTTLNRAGGVSAVNAAKFDVTRANRLAFLPANAITIEYTQDNGATWTDYGATDDEKKSLFAMTRGWWAQLGKTGTAAVGFGLRVTIEPTDRYTYVDDFYCWFTTSGHTVKLKIEYSTIGAKTTFTTLRENLDVSGWSGANEITFSAGTFGGSSNQTSNRYAYRFTFINTAINSSTTNQLSAVSDIRLYGDNAWTTPNSMMLRDHIYNWDTSQNVSFPAKVTASSGGFVGALSGNASTATKLATARTIDGVSFDGTAAITHYGVCETLSAVAAKVVSCPGFTLMTGAEITVFFKNTNSASDPTLNINNTGAKQMYYRGDVISNSFLYSNRTYKFVYDGTNYNIIGDLDVDTKTTAGASVKNATKLFLIGATSQTTAPTTYSNNFVYVGTDNCLYSNKKKVATVDDVSSLSTLVGTTSVATQISDYAAPKNHTHDYAAASHTHSYLPLSGGTMTGDILIAAGGVGGKINGSATNGGINTILIGDDVWLGDCNTGGTLGLKANSGASAGFSFYGSDGTNFGRLYYDASGGHSTSVFYGAAWNDYAEFRICKEQFIPGQVVSENGDDTLSISTERLQRGCSIISDTFGFAIGETDEAKCPITVSGRVLAYPFEPIEDFRNHIGYPVCSGPNGTVSIMTEEEEEKYPSRIIGTISAIPDYETWGSGNVEVKNRVWIKVK